MLILMISLLSHVNQEYNLGKTIVFADKSMTTGINIFCTLSTKDGYIFTLFVEGGNKNLKICY